MSQSERLRTIQELYTKKWIPRNKPRDASEITYMRQARAAAGTPLNATVSGKVADPSVTGKVCCAQVTARGKGTGDSLGILMAKQGCAVCSDPDPYINRGVTIPAPCVDEQVPPFTQQNVSTPYVCKSSGFNKYFPRPDNCTPIVFGKSSGFNANFPEPDIFTTVCPKPRVVFPSG